MTYETIKTERRDASFIITLNRPERRNAISTQLMEELVAAAGEAEADAGVRGIIITGGGSYFSAGADLADPGRAHQHQAIRERVTIDQVTKGLFGTLVADKIKTVPRRLHLRFGWRRSATSACLHESNRSDLLSGQCCF